MSNLDFVESIFGNGGDPYLPENDASLDPERWTGHTGCVILAPHLTRVTKQSLGLPHWDLATPRQRRDGMCYKAEDELYNGGSAFKICARDARGVIVTLIADNYFGYCKKEVKTQISYSANLFGSAEEEHSGGALVFPELRPGRGVHRLSRRPSATRSRRCSRATRERFAPQPEGHALDRTEPHIVLVPEKSTFSLRTQTVSWQHADGRPVVDQAAAPARPTCGPAAIRVQMEPVRGRARRMASGRHLAPRSPPATSPARFPAAASRRSPRRSPTRSSPGTSSSPTSRATWTPSRRSSRAISPTVSRPGRRTASITARS